MCRIKKTLLSGAFALMLLTLTACSYAVNSDEMTEVTEITEITEITEATEMTEMTEIVVTDEETEADLLRRLVDHIVDNDLRFMRLELIDLNLDGLPELIAGDYGAALGYYEIFYIDDGVVQEAYFGETLYLLVSSYIHKETREPLCRVDMIGYDGGNGVTNSYEVLLRDGALFMTEEETPGVVYRPLFRRIYNRFEPEEPYIYCGANTNYAHRLTEDEKLLYREGAYTEEHWEEITQEEAAAITEAFYGAYQRLTLPHAAVDIVEYELYSDSFDYGAVLDTLYDEYMASWEEMAAEQGEYFAICNLQ